MIRIYCFAALITCLTPTFATAGPLALLEAPSTAKLVAEYLGLIESVESKVDRLIDADLKTAVALLEQINVNPERAGHLIKDARVAFTRAAAIQSDSMDESRRHKRALALLGLWACCRAVGDVPNAKKSLEKIATIPDTPTWVLGYKLRLLQKVKFRLGLFRVPTSSDDLTDQFADAVGYYTVEDFREFSSDYDSLLKLIAAADAKLLSLQDKDTASTIVGKWNAGLGRKYEFSSDKSVRVSKNYGVSEGTYKVLDKGRVRLKCGGVVETFNYRVYSDLLLISSKGIGEGMTDRFTRTN